MRMVRIGERKKLLPLGCWV